VRRTFRRPPSLSRTYVRASKKSFPKRGHGDLAVLPRPEALSRHRRQ
jgi:hypothetical protein